jgi:hypothetical protein
LTLLNGRGDAFDLRYKLGTEKFVFEELAFNSSINLAEENPEQVFGMENNAAMRAIGRNFHSSRTQTFTQIPPEKRPTFLRALDTLCPLFASDAEKAKIRLDERPNIRSRNFGFLTARILKNFDKIAGLERSGKLTAANLAKLCFPEIKNPGPDPIKSVNRLFDRWYAERYGDTNEDGDWIDPKYPTKLAGTMQNIMEATGCTIEEAFEVANGSKMPSPNVQYYSPGSMSIESLDGTTNIARREVQGDINRPDNYMYKGGKHLLAETSFRFNLPGEEPIATNATPEGKANVTKVMDKLEALCGKTHVQQASSLLMMVSQSGLSVLRGGLDCYGIESSEHSSVDFTISKNETTGDITIRYSAPKELPFRFEWTATIKPDGYVSTTPLKFVDQEKVAAIKTAVDLAKSKVTLKNANDPNAAKLGSYIETIMNATDGDPTLLDFFQDQDLLESLLFSVTNDLRSLDDVSRKVDGLKANIEELRTATKGDDAMFSVGVKRLKTFRGKALPNGVLTALVNAAAKADISKLRNIHAASTPAQFHNAFMQYHEGMCRIVEDSKVFKTYKNEMGGDEIMNVQLLSGSLLAARCGNADALRAMKAALHSDHAAKANSVYGMIMDGDFNLDNTPEYVTMSVQNIGKQLNMRLNELDQNLSDILGEEPERVSEYQGEKDGFMPDVVAILSNVRDVTLTLHSQLVEETRKGMME